MEKVKKQYGLWTGIAMVIGIVIGSGVFLKAGGVLASSGGDLKMSILAWFIGGVIMVASGFCFAVYATRITKYNGVVDYVETATNKKVGYGLAWLITTFYYPIIASVVSLFAGQYFFQLIGVEVGLTDWQNFIFAFVILLLFVLLNYFSPILASKFQVSSTVVKLVPIGIIAIAGLPDIYVGETICEQNNPVALPLIHVSEPTVQMNFGTNTSPFVGRDGKILTARKIEERLFKETQSDVSLRVERIENKEEYRIVTTSSIVAYFLQKEKSDLLVDDNDIYAGENVICHVEVEDTGIVAHYYMEKIKLLRKNAKAMILVPGLRAYYNIYFNLYQNKEYYKIEEYYQTIKK